ncbi:MAG: ribosome maturation factor RimM [Caldisericia bacterium]
MGNWITIGEIVSIWGVSNSFNIKKLSNNEERFKNLKKIYIQKENEDPEIINIKEVVNKNDHIIIKLNDNLKENIKNYIGRFLVIPEEDLKKLKDGEYYIFQLINLNAYDINGNLLGKVIKYIENPKANDLIIILNKEEIAVPFIKEFIKEINLKENRIIVQNI